MLDEGSVSTGVFGLICLGSLAHGEKPMMYRFALEFMGPDAERGREFANLRQYKEFRRAFVVITVVWGAAYLVEAAVRVPHRAGDLGRDGAGGVRKVLPYAVAAVLIAWTVGYGRLQKHQGDGLAGRVCPRGDGRRATEAARTAETEEVDRSVEKTRAGDATAQADTGDAHQGEEMGDGPATAGPAVHRESRRPEDPGRRGRLEHPITYRRRLPGLHRRQPLA